MDIINLDKINELISFEKFEDAKILLEELIKDEPNNIEALKLLGLCNVNLGFFLEGKKVFETVVKFKNDDATSWFYLANCYDNLDDFRHAQTAYNQVISLRENYLDAYKNLGIVYIKDQKPQLALDIAKKALLIEQNDFLLYYLAGTALLSLKDCKSSIPYFEKAVELNADHSQLYNNIGTAYLTIGNYAKAFESYLKASNLDPRNSLTFYNIASILQIQNKHKEAVEYFKKAYSLESVEHYLVSLALSEFKAEMYQDAIHHYKMLVSQHPEKHNFQYNLACCYEKTGEFIFAIGILDQLVILNPKSKIMLLRLAKLYLKTDKPIKAKEIYERLFQQGIVSEEIYYEYALICVETGDLDIAEKILKKVIELNPNAAYARKDLGVIYLNKRLFDYAKDEFEKAYETMPEDIGVVFEYANFLHSISEFKKAQELYQKAYVQKPDDPNILIFNALNLLSLNNLDEALEYIQLAIKIVPGEYIVQFLAGKIYYGLKNFEDAKMFLVKAWEQNPNVEVENLLGLTYFELGEYETANNIFLKLLKANDVNTNLLLSSAKCYEKLSQPKKSKEQLDKVLAIFPDSEEAQEMLKQMNLSA